MPTMLYQCEACGAPLEVKQNAKNVQCQYCGHWHGIKREGGRTVIDDINAWVCPHCDTPNQVNTNYCGSCSKRISQICLNCSQLSEISKPYCTNCGENKEEEFIKRKEGRLCVLEKKIQEEQIGIQELLKDDSSIFKRLVEIFNYSDSALFVVMLLLAASLVLLLLSIIVGYEGTCISISGIMIFGFSLALISLFFHYDNKLNSEEEQELLAYNENIKIMEQKVHIISNSNYEEVDEFSFLEP